MTRARRIHTWLAERYAVDAARQRLHAATVAHGGPLALHLLIALAVFFAGVELATGMLLGFYYQPSTAGAHDSVRHILTTVEFGDLVRSLHAWGAHLLVGTLYAVLLVALALGMHRRPHGPAWAAGVLLAFVALSFAFTGDLLPWTERSLVSARVAGGAAGHVPLVGRWVEGLLLGGSEPGATALVRVYGFHAGLLPAAGTGLALLLAGHQALLRRDGPRPPGLALYPNVALRALAVWVLGLMVLLVLAVIAPPTLGATPTGVGAGARPAWYLLFAHEALRLVPGRVLGIPGATVAVCALLGGAALALALPLLDRRNGRVGQALGLALFLVLLGVTGRALLT